MLNRILALSGVASIAAIFVLAAIVLDAGGGAPAPGDEAVASVLAGAGDALPDPAANGVVILSSDWQLYSYTADGEASGGPFPPAFGDGLSTDGAWAAYQHCLPTEGCKVVILAAGAAFVEDTFEANAVDLEAAFVSGEWSRSGARFAALDNAGNLYIVDPSTREARLVQDCCVTAFAWTAGDDLLIGGRPRAGGEFWLARASADGAVTEVAKVPAEVTRFFESPDATQFAFALNGIKNFGIAMVDTLDWRLTDFGELHERTYGEGPQFAIAWSSDQRYLAVGPVSAPYALYILDIPAGRVAGRHTFEEGYAGELAWSPTGDVLAISTYSPDRTRHEVYVVDAGGEGPRHLLGGCRIIWSPDGLFLAVKSEPHTLGASAVNVDTGHQWRLSRTPGMTPVAWGIDEASALTRAKVTTRSAAVLGK